MFSSIQSTERFDFSVTGLRNRRLLPRAMPALDADVDGGFHSFSLEGKYR